MKTRVITLRYSEGLQGFHHLSDLLSWFRRVIEWTTPEVPAYCYRLNQESNMSAPKLPKPDLPIHLRQAIQLASCVLRRIKEKQAQKAAEVKNDCVGFSQRIVMP